MKSAAQGQDWDDHALGIPPHLRDDPPAATPSWPERVIVDGREVPVIIDPMLPDYVGLCEWDLDFQGNPTTPKRIVLRAREERVLLHEVLHCLLGDNEALVRRATLLYDLGWRLEGTDPRCRLSRRCATSVHP